MQLHQHERIFEEHSEDCDCDECYDCDDVVFRWDEDDAQPGSYDDWKEDWQ